VTRTVSARLTRSLRVSLTRLPVHWHRGTVTVQSGRAQASTTVQASSTAAPVGKCRSDSEGRVSSPESGRVRVRSVRDAASLRLGRTQGQASPPAPGRRRPWAANHGKPFPDTFTVGPGRR
jgi:hypothetical protein